MWDKEKINHELTERNSELTDKVSDLEKENEALRNELDEIGDGAPVSTTTFSSDGQDLEVRLAVIVLQYMLS